MLLRLETNPMYLSSFVPDSIYTCIFQKNLELNVLPTHWAYTCLHFYNFTFLRFTIFLKGMRSHGLVRCKAFTH
jgi:hypothetical protein